MFGVVVLASVATGVALASNATDPKNRLDERTFGFFDSGVNMRNNDPDYDKSIVSFEISDSTGAAVLRFSCGTRCLQFLNQGEFSVSMQSFSSDCFRLRPFGELRTARAYSCDPTPLLFQDHLVLSKGYPFEKHYVTTEDGYIITMHRIPHGRNVQATATPNRKVAVLGAPLLTLSTIWVMDMPNNSFGRTSWWYDTSG